MKSETVLRKKRIAVVTKRENVSNFLRMEAESCRCDVSVMSLLPLSFSEYDIVIVDDDGSYTVPVNVTGVYRIISDSAESGENTFYWPMPVNDLRELYEGYAIRSEALSSNRDENVIFLADKNENAVIYKNRKIVLTEGEMKVLLCLGKAEGKPVGREKLLELFDAYDGNIADVYICHLRRKIEDPFGVKLIKTVRGKGYLLSSKFTVI